MTPRPVLLTGVTAIDADGAVDDAWLHLADGLIAARGSGRPPTVPEADHLDGTGLLVTPGFLDLHVHGGGGAGVEDGAASVPVILAAHRRHGTTAAVLSLVSAPVDVLVERLADLAALVPGTPGLLGTHLEGPFLGAGRRGAHAAHHLVDPDPASVDRLIAAAAGTLRQITLDPDRPGAFDAIARFTGAGVRVAVGHTDADHATAGRAFDAGASILTHTFNAMPGIHHRDPGPVLAALQRPGVTLELVLDGVHVHPAVAALLLSAAPGRVALITDAMAAAGMPDGRYGLGELAVQVTQGIARVDGTDTLAGSTLTQDAAVRAALQGGMAAPDAVAAVTAVPARALGLAEHRGLLRPGHIADVVLLDRAWAVQRVVVGGSAGSDDRRSVRASRDP